MKNIFRTQLVLAAVVSLAGAACFAQSPSPAATNYKNKCQSCHGATGTPSMGMAKAMGIKANTDPAVKDLTADQMFAAVKNGKGKMKAVIGLTDAQIKDVVAYYRGLK